MTAHCKIGWVKVRYKGRSITERSLLQIGAAHLGLEFKGTWSGFWWWRRP